MSLVRRRLDRRSVDTLAELLAQLRGPASDAGEQVTDETARRSAAVWAATELVAGTISSFPVDEVGAGGRRSTTAPMIASPSASMTRETWMHQLVMSVLLRGNGYVWLTDFDARGYPQGGEVLHPDVVRWTHDGGRWVCRIDNVEQDIWPLGELFHVPLFVSPGAPFGASPIEMHRQTIGLPIAAQRFGARFFGSGAHPTTLLMPDSDPGEDGARSLKRKFMEATFGSREPIVVPQHVKVERLSIAPDESQFLETQRYGVEEVARVFLGGFAEMIGGSTSGQSVTYANAEQRDAAFLRYGLSRYLVPLEASLSTLLPRGRKVKFNVASLLRGDLAARYASYRVSAEIEALTGKPVLMSDEIRELEDRPPLPDDYASGRVVPTPARER